MEALGTMVGFFSQKVNEKVVQIRALSLQHSADVYGAQGRTPPSFGLRSGVRHTTHIEHICSTQSRFEVSLYLRFPRGLSFGSNYGGGGAKSGCGGLLPPHGLGLPHAAEAASVSAVAEADVRGFVWRTRRRRTTQNPRGAEQVTASSLSRFSISAYKDPSADLCLLDDRDAYRVALAPHHPWLLRQAAEWVFLALPERRYFLQLVCVQTQKEATPVLRVIIHALMLVHTRTQRILAEHNMLELPWRQQQPAGT